MFNHLTPQPADKILSLMQAFRADPRDAKIDLGVGVYKDATGNTPVMRAVKEAERRLVAEQTSKAYTGLAGDAAFSETMIDLILSDAVDTARIAAAATPGGTGAIRQACELIKMASPQARVWISAPTWPNHPSILKYTGIPFSEYRYFDEESCGVDVAGMLEDLEGVAKGDVVLLHGCCHNPTGANLTLAQMEDVVRILQRRGAFPMVDIAYQGFGDGLDLDAQATRLIAKSFDRCLIAASCSKNFGVYRERAGLLISISPSSEQGLTQKTLMFLNRQNFSFPPDHGARVVSSILQDGELRKDWESELEATRLGMLNLRKQLADELKRLTSSDRFDFITHHRGMFSRLGVAEDKVLQMREEHAIYMVGDSRINIAGLNAQTVPLLAKALVEVEA